MAQKLSKEDETTVSNNLYNDADIVYPSGLKLVLIMTSMFVGMFLVSLDRLIVSTAIPEITNEFNSAGDIGWYGTAYMLTNCALQLVFGKIYTCFHVKHVFLTSIMLFEVGSAICGAAPSSIAFIIGRAIAGVGSGGVMSGVLVIVVYAVPLHNRPKWQGMIGAVFGVSSITGPLIGGAFTTNVTWRWCFYLNLPLGGVVVVVIFFLLDIADPANKPTSLVEKLKHLNLSGVLVLVLGVVCLCLALQWGGTKYAWNARRIIALLVLAGLFLIAFALIQVAWPKTATLPPRIFIQRSIFSGFWVSCCQGGHIVMLIYYLPIWFQAIQNVSAVSSGIHLLPMVIPLIISAVVTGQLVSRIGYYTPFMIFGVCLASIGSGLLTTLQIDTAKGMWIVFQILYGFGLGCCAQAPNMAAQTVLPREDVAIGASLMFFGQQVFGSIFTTVGQSILDNQLTTRLANLPNITPELIQNTGATEFLNLISTEDHTAALNAYNDSLRACFRVALILACTSIPGAFFMEWRSVKKNTLKATTSKEAVTEQGKAEHGLGQGDGDNAEVKT